MINYKRTYRNYLYGIWRLKLLSYLFLFLCFISFIFFIENLSLNIFLDMVLMFPIILTAGGFLVVEEEIKEKYSSKINIKNLFFFHYYMKNYAPLLIINYYFGLKDKNHQKNYMNHFINFLSKDYEISAEAHQTHGLNLENNKTLAIKAKTFLNLTSTPC